MSRPVEVSVSQFVALLNQTLELSYPDIDIVGELANLRISKNKWLYFDLKDEHSTVKFFGTVYHLPGPLEEGMLVKVRGTPRLHNLYGFSVNVIKIQPAGEGSIKKAAELLRHQLEKEGLFDPARKRTIPFPPQKIGLITSSQSAAYADFIKIINARWSGLEIQLIDVQVQGEVAPDQIASAIESFNSAAETADALVVIRGGGSAEDLAAFSSEMVTRAVAASRIPTVVAIGHETDLSLAELAADRRASTPSNAAELLVPDKREVVSMLVHKQKQIFTALESVRQQARTNNQQLRLELVRNIDFRLDRALENNLSSKKLLIALSPHSIQQRGYAIVRHKQRAISSLSQITVGDIVDISVSDGAFNAQVKSTQEN